jgi:hypothetical protein
METTGDTVSGKPECEKWPFVENREGKASTSTKLQGPTGWVLEV